VEAGHGYVPVCSSAKDHDDGAALDCLGDEVEAVPLAWKRHGKWRPFLGVVAAELDREHPAGEILIADSRSCHHLTQALPGPLAAGRLCECVGQVGLDVARRVVGEVSPQRRNAMGWLEVGRLGPGPARVAVEQDERGVARTGRWLGRNLQCSRPWSRLALMTWCHASTYGRSSSRT
jgi:hypothetical protein